MRNQKIRTSFDHVHPSFPSLHLGGWLSTEDTYLGLYDDSRCYGFLGGQKLYRLAKAIVRRFEEKQKVDATR